MAVYDFIVTRGAAAAVVEDEDCCPFEFDCVFFVARRRSRWIMDAIQRNECDPVPASKKSPKDTGGGESLASSLFLVLFLVTMTTASNNNKQQQQQQQQIPKTK